MTARAILAGALGVVLVATTACSALGGDADRDDAASTLTVFAAASLAAPFEEIAADFVAQNPGTEVTFSFAGSSDLAAQIIDGAPADVFASADEATMQLVVDAGLAPVPVPFATNRLTMVVAEGNPRSVLGLADLAARAADGDLDLVVCAPVVPCGATARRVADAAGVTWAPRSEERSVSDVLGKVTSGQADAGLTYVTDALAARDQVDAIAFEDTPALLAASSTTYPVAALADAHADAAAFAAFLRTPAAREVLAEAGFRPVTS